MASDAAQAGPQDEWSGPCVVPDCGSAKGRATGSPWGEKEVRLSCSGVWGPGPCTRTPSCRLDYSGRVSPAKRGMREFRGDGREGLGVQ